MPEPMESKEREVGVNEEERWEKVRRIVREENERLEQRLIAALGREKKTKVDFANGKWVGITAQLQESWASACPGVDIPTELIKAAAWIMSNPTLAPKTQFSRFLLSWFSRTQDRLSIRSIPMQSNSKPVPMTCAYCSSPATGSTGGYKHCSSRECFDRAMGGEKPRKTA